MYNWYKMETESLRATIMAELAFSREKVMASAVVDAMQVAGWRLEISQGAVNVSPCGNTMERQTTVRIWDGRKNLLIERSCTESVSA